MERDQWLLGIGGGSEMMIEGQEGIWGLAIEMFCVLIIAVASQLTCLSECIDLYTLSRHFTKEDTRIASKFVERR